MFFSVFGFFVCLSCVCVLPSCCSCSCSCCLRERLNETELVVSSLQRQHSSFCLQVQAYAIGRYVGYVLPRHCTCTLENCVSVSYVLFAGRLSQIHRPVESNCLLRDVIGCELYQDGSMVRDNNLDCFS